VSGVEKVLVIGPSWVGDMVMAQALYRLLVQRAEKTEIHVVAPAWSLPVLARVPEVTRGIELAVGHGELGLATERDRGEHGIRLGVEGGRVLADVEVDGLGDFFAGERTLVWIPVDQRRVIGVPPEAISNRYGIDYVRLVSGTAPMEVAVIIGETFDTVEGARIEILSGLRDGDKVATP